MTATIYFVDSEKGGTGKSWVTRTLHYVMAKQNRKFIGIDADTANPTYGNIYQDAFRIPFSIDPSEEDAADSIFDMAIGSEATGNQPRDVLISLPAQAHRAVSKWIFDKGVIELAEENGITLHKIWVSDGEQDSIELFIKSLERYNGKVRHLFLKNFGRCSEWEYFDSYAKVQTAIQNYQVPVVNFPKLGDFRRIRVNAERLTFEAAADLMEFGVLGRGQIKTFLKAAETAFEQGGLFGTPSPEAMTIAQSAKTTTPKTKKPS